MTGAPAIGGMGIGGMGIGGTGIGAVGIGAPGGIGIGATGAFIAIIAGAAQAWASLFEAFVREHPEMWQFWLDKSWSRWLIG